MTIRMTSGVLAARRHVAGVQAVAMRAIAMRAIPMLALAACRGAGDPRPAVREPLAIANALLSEAHLPKADTSHVVRKDMWAVATEPHAGSLKLLLLYTVDSLVLPDGPLELSAPITYLRFESNAWHQHHDAKGAVMLTDATVQQLSTTLTDTTRVYFFRVESMSVGTTALDSLHFSRLVRTAAKDLPLEVARLRRSGFISADAEP